MISSTKNTPSKSPKTAADKPFVESSGESIGAEAKYCPSICGSGLTPLSLTTSSAWATFAPRDPKNWTTKVVSTPSKSPSTTATPISSYLGDIIFSLCDCDAIQASTTEEGLAKSLAKFSPAKRYV